MRLPVSFSCRRALTWSFSPPRSYTAVEVFLFWELAARDTGDSAFECDARDFWVVSATCEVFSTARLQLLRNQDTMRVRAAVDDPTPFARDENVSASLSDGRNHEASFSEQAKILSFESGDRGQFTLHIHLAGAGLLVLRRLSLCSMFCSISRRKKARRIPKEGGGRDRGLFLPALHTCYV